MRIAVALALSALVSCAASAQVSRTFNDWTAACDNGRGCALVGMGAEASFRSAHILIQRGGDPADPPSVSIAVARGAKPGKFSVELAFDDPAAGSALPAKAEVEAYDDGLVFYTVPTNKIGEFVGALRKARTLTVRRGDVAKTSDDREAVISLAGSIAALRWMDDQQKRADTASALVATGSKPAGAAPPPLPKVTTAAFKPREMKGAPAAPVTAAWKKACSHDWSYAEGAREDVKSYDLGSGTRMWMLPCSSGTRNRIMLIALQTAAGVRAVPFDRLEKGKIVTDDQGLSNPTFDIEERSLTFGPFDDCGERGRYVWNGSAFRLVEFFAIEPCRSIDSLSWPAMYRAQVVPAR